MKNLSVFDTHNGYTLRQSVCGELYRFIISVYNIGFILFHCLRPVYHLVNFCIIAPFSLKLCLTKYFMLWFGYSNLQLLH